MKNSLWTAALATALAGPGPALAKPDAELLTVLDDCFASVAGEGLDALSAYQVTFQEERTPKPLVENLLYTGEVRIGLGTMVVEALSRDGVVFDCTMLNRPGDQGGVKFAEAMPTLENWFGSAIAFDGLHDTMADSRFFGFVFCEPGVFAVGASATSLDAVPVEVSQPGSDEPIPGDLRFAVYLTNPDNFEDCR